MKILDIMQYLLDTYDKDEDIEWAFLIDKDMMKLDYYI